MALSCSRVPAPRTGGGGSVDAAPRGAARVAAAPQAPRTVRDSRRDVAPAAVKSPENSLIWLEAERGWKQNGRHCRRCCSVRCEVVQQRYIAVQPRLIRRHGG